MTTPITRRQSALRSLMGQANEKPVQIGPRYSVQPANFPRELWLVWDHRLGRNLTGEELNAKNPPRHPWFGRITTAEKIADRLNRAEG